MQIVNCCLRNKIEVESYFLSGILKAKKSLVATKAFLNACEESGLRLRGIELPFDVFSLEWALLFVSYGVSHKDTCGGSLSPAQIFSNKNINKVNWQNKRQRNFLFTNILEEYRIGTWKDILAVKTFMQREYEENTTMTKKTYKEFLAYHKTMKEKAQVKFFAGKDQKESHSCSC